MLGMKSKQTLYYFVIFAVFFGCDSVKNTDKRLIKKRNYLSARDIVIVSDSATWNGRKGDILRDIFEQPLDGVPREEKSYNLFHVDNDKNYSSRPIIIYLNDEILKYEIDEFRLSSGKIKMKINMNSDVYEDEFIKNGISAFEKVRENEISGIRERHQKLNNAIATGFIKETFNIDVYVPVDYTVLERQNNFFQAKSHLSDMNIKNEDTTVVRDIIKYIMVFDFQLNDNITINQQILEKTNLFLKQYIPGTKESQYLKIDINQPIKEKNGQYSGMWTMNDGVMAGSIIIKTRYHLNMVKVSLGILYDPKGDKIEHIRTFEAIL